MPTSTYFAYTTDALTFSGGTVSLAADYDQTVDRVTMVIDDDDDVFEGDLNNNEDGNDGNQFGEVFDLDGNSIAGGSDVTIYSEFQYVLTGDDGSQITMFSVEIDSNPASNAGAGIFVGFLPSAPLQPGVTYTFTTTNTTPSNDFDYSDIEGAICFTPGTLIRTPRGLRLVEDLAVGDAVITADHGVQTLRWTGRRAYDRPSLSAAPHLAPVLIRRGALGPDLPDRDMVVSPQHRMLVTGSKPLLMLGESEVLCSARSLINGRTVTQAPRSAATYIHLMFDQHEVIWANGCATESLFPGDSAFSAMQAEARHEMFQIFPELRADLGAYGCAARPVARAYEAAMIA